MKKCKGYNEKSSKALDKLFEKFDDRLIKLEDSLKSEIKKRVDTEKQIYFSNNYKKDRKEFENKTFNQLTLLHDRYNKFDNTYNRLSNLEDSIDKKTSILEESNKRFVDYVWKEFSKYKLKD